MERDFKRLDRTSSPDDAPIPFEAEPEPSAKPARPSSASAPGASPSGSAASLSPRLEVTPSKFPQAKPNAKAESAAACPQCGYSLKGLKSSRCPECGCDLLTAITAAARRKETGSQLKHEYLKALGMVAAGFAGVALLLALRGEIAEFPYYLLSYAITVPIGVAVFFICSLIWIGFDAPWGITTLRLAGIYALVDIVAQMMGFLPINLIGPVVTTITYLILLQKYLEIDQTDAIAVALITGVIKVFIAIGIASMMA
jgi:hypothetical protein